jgi:hypothetical protein
MAMSFIERVGVYYSMNSDLLFRVLICVHFLGIGNKYTVKKVGDFPVPRRDVTNQTLPGRE